MHTLASKDRVKSPDSACCALQSQMVSPVAKALPGKLHMDQQSKALVRDSKPLFLFNKKMLFVIFANKSSKSS